ncbi:hypothetical protein E2562_007315 [Oryza meyeriana var. granulata]|uniref:Uncharacterized protein n=1 Tax=Oryza meyeriana var. granulata TaxID=110450 RepID=A0A6G1CZG2_9ORYZ|nr:hypothetical protein E2562_007315 [Oryza meyeriana var. granulata]
MARRCDKAKGSHGQSKGRVEGSLSFIGAGGARRQGREAVRNRAVGLIFSLGAGCQDAARSADATGQRPASIFVSRGRGMRTGMGMVDFGAWGDIFFGEAICRTRAALEGREEWLEEEDGVGVRRLFVVWALAIGMRERRRGRLASGPRLSVLCVRRRPALGWARVSGRT